jgi:hypothetical protein
MAQKNDRLSLPALILLLALSLGLGTYYRTVALDARPMHPATHGGPYFVHAETLFMCSFIHSLNYVLYIS